MTHKQQHLWNINLPARHYWFGAFTASVINLTGMLFEFGLSRSVPGVPVWPAICSAVIGAICCVVLINLRSYKKIFFLASLYVVNIASVIATFFITNPYFASRAEGWFPFQGSKLGCMIAALIAPSFFFGCATIASYVLVAALQFFSFSQELRRHLVDEPWALFAFGLAAFLILLFRFIRMSLERRVIESQVEITTIKKYAKILLGLRDMMNTPLQTLEFSVGILLNDGASDQVVLDKMMSALKTLKSSKEVLSQYEQDFDWDQEELSFDPKKLIS